ncbi:MAG TPA: hypothetical protein VF030_04090, partial [Solirubrobacterales bacterium]
LSVVLEEPGEPESAKDLLIDLPLGYFLYPSLHVRCTTNQFGNSECPVDSQVGVVTVRGHFDGNPEYELGKAPVYLLLPASNGPTRLGFVIPTVEIPVEATVTASLEEEYGLELALRNFPQTAPLRSLDLTLWGVPADPVHDEERFPLVPGGRPASVPEAPFTRTPTSCEPGRNLSVKADSHQDPGDFATATVPAPIMGSCGNLAFDPVFEVGLTSSQASAPVGLSLTVDLPGNLAPSGLSSSDAEEIFVALPPQLELNEEALPSAPAPIGSFAATVLGLETPFGGSVLFLGPFTADVYRVALVGSGNGINLALMTLLAYDPATGSWAINPVNMPQLPFAELKLQIPSGIELFTAPSQCGTFQATGDFLPRSGGSIRSATAPLTIDAGPGGGPCPTTPTPPTPPVVSPAPSSTPPPAAAAPLPEPKPLVRLRRWPPPRTRDRTPTFGFAANVAGSTFECKLDNRSLPRCKSPLTLPRLSPGRHVFKVRTVTPGGAKSFFAIYGFTVRR